MRRTAPLARFPPESSARGLRPLPAHRALQADGQGREGASQRRVIRQRRDAQAGLSVCEGVGGGGGSFGLHPRELAAPMAPRRTLCTHDMSAALSNDKRQ